MAHRDRTRKKDGHARLLREKTALKSVFDRMGWYEVRTPLGETVRLFVVSEHPWRFSTLRQREAARAAE